MGNSAIVHLIDDDEDVRKALAFLLATAGLAVKVYDSGLSFLDTLSSLQSGCIVSDVRMPGIDGLELLRRLRALDINLPVVIMTGHADVPLAVEAMKAGAIDFIEKPFGDEMFLSAITAALSRYSQAAHHDTEVQLIQTKFAALSARERQVLQGLLAGHPNKTIAYDLEISPRTVEVHRANVMTKMAAHSLSDLIRMCMSAKVVPNI